jgi:branched-chain amino acid transport system substrate-binding protein
MNVSRDSMCPGVDAGITNSQDTQHMDPLKKRVILLLLSCFFALCASAQHSPGTGVTANEIKIGNITCATGWAKEYAAVAGAEAAYFAMVNDRGGINRRKIKFLSRDNGCDSQESLALAKQLVEQDGVLLLFSVLGTESNLAIRPYMNEKQVPQLFLESSSAVFDDPSRFPWTMGFFTTYRTEGRAYGKYILLNKPGGKIAVLSANDETDREFVAGLREGLGAKAPSMIVLETVYEDSDSSLDGQLQALKNSGADVFMNFSIGQFATLAIRKAFDLDWHPLQFIPNASISVAASLEPAGLNKASGIISNARSKGWHTPQAQRDPAVREFLDWMSKYNPEASLRDQNNVAGYERAQALVEVLKACGNDLTRANVMKKAASLDMELPMLRPGIRVQTTPVDYQPIKQLFLIQFAGKEWRPVGPIS